MGGCLVCLVFDSSKLNKLKLRFTTFNVLAIKFNPSLIYFLFIFVGHGEQTGDHKVFLSKHSRLLKRLLHVSLHCNSFPVLWPNSDSSATGEPRIGVGAAFKFVRHGCKLSLLTPSSYPNP